MKAILKAFQQFPVIGRGQEGSNQWENEINPFKRDIMRNAYRFLEDSNSTLDDMIHAVRVVGHLSYAGGPEASSFAVQYIPHLMALVQRAEVPIELKVQILMSVSQMCHHCREGHKTIREPPILQTIVDLIGQDEHVAAMRWACYLLYICVADNIPFLRDVSEVPGIRDRLESSACLQISWEGWPGNIPGILINLMGPKP